MPLVHLPAGVSLTADLLRQIIEACDPCDNCSGSGSSGSGIPMPNGCAGCDCCPCVCWWATTWHKEITADSLLIGPVVSTWSLVSNGLTQVGGDPDYMYLGDVGSGGGGCTIGGLIAIDDNGDVISDITDPAYPKWEGDLVYTNGVDTVTLNVTIRLTFELQFGCDGSVADGFVWSGTTINSGTLPPGETGNYFALSNDVIGGLGTFTDCGGCIEIGFGGNGVVLPDFCMTPLYDPDC